MSSDLGSDVVTILMQFPITFSACILKKRRRTVVVRGWECGPDKLAPSLVHCCQFGRETFWLFGLVRRDVCKQDLLRLRLEAIFKKHRTFWRECGRVSDSVTPCFYGSCVVLLFHILRLVFMRSRLYLWLCLYALTSGHFRTGWWHWLFGAMFYLLIASLGPGIGVISSDISKS